MRGKGRVLEFFAAICRSLVVGVPRPIGLTRAKAKDRNLLFRILVVIATAVLLFWPFSQIEPSLVTKGAVQEAQLTIPLEMQPLKRLVHRLPFAETMSLAQTTATL